MTSAPHSNKCVLVADDSQTMRMLIFIHLIKVLPGIKLVEAVNGSDALEKMRRLDVDLVVTDMNMPEMDGAGLISAIRNDLKRDTPIVVVTTRGEQDDRERGLALGANGYITKPIDVYEFRKTILHFIA